MMEVNILRGLLEPYKVYGSGSGSTGSMSLEPFERGFGLTIGNALRRVLISSIEGCAVAAIQIKGVDHEFSAVENVREDAVSIVCNVKSLRFTNISDAPVLIKLSSTTPGKLYASALSLPIGVKCITPNAYICELTANTDFDMYLLIKKSRGYIEGCKEDSRSFPMPQGAIEFGNNYSAVTNVAFRVDKIRLVNNTDCERLHIDVSTDGSITPNDAIKRAGVILVRQFSRIGGVVELSDVLPTDNGNSVNDANNDMILYEKLAKGIDHLELTVRSYNCLVFAEIDNVFKLVSMTEEELMKLPNFGKKSLNEVRAVLDLMSLNLGVTIPETVLKMFEKTESKVIRHSGLEE
jgi:DNA-directed RNA polymerase subunit alpha